MKKNKYVKRVFAVMLGGMLLLCNTTSALAASNGSWNFSATPGNNESPRTIKVDYSSDGYVAVIANKSGSSPLNTVQIKSYYYSKNGDTLVDIVELSEKGKNFYFGKPLVNTGVISFYANLRWQKGYTAYNQGTISRR